MDFKQARIVYMGTPDLAASLLEKLLTDGFNIVALIAQPDTSSGRKGHSVPVATKIVAQTHHIPVYQPLSIREDHDFITKFDCDLIVTLAYGQIVPDEVLNWPKLGALNVHGSLLPKLRGAAPIQYALMQGLNQTGITLMRMVTRMDAGDMFARLSLDIMPEDDYGSLRAKMSLLINQRIPELLKQYLNGQLIAQPQDERLATFAPSIKKEQEHLNIELKCHEFINFVRGLSPEPGGYLLDETGNRIKIYNVRYYDDHTDWDKGIVLVENKCLLLQLCNGRIIIDRLQIPGKRVMSATDFLLGHQKISGAVWK
jgi:methionyl-tRNA formyltransferase